MAKSELILSAIKKWHGLNCVRENLNVLQVDDRNFRAIFNVGEKHTTPTRFLHGGYAAILMDVAANAILSASAISENRRKPLDFNIDYMNASRVGEDLLIEGESLKIGKNVSYLEVKIFLNETKKLLSKGSLVFAT